MTTRSKTITTTLKIQTNKTMKHTFNNIFYSFIVSAFALAFSACQDDFPYVPGAPIPEGITEVSVKATFKDFTPALDTRSPGNALESITELWMVLFDGDGDYLEKRKIEDFEVTQVENQRPDGAESSEAKTAHVEFKQIIPNGYYYIYFVANHNLETKDVTSIDKLKKLPLEWDSSDVGKNAQMFGFLEDASIDDSAGEEKKGDNKFTAPKIGIRPGVSGHAWLTRAASKLTVAFNTTKLNENVYIYLKSITIKDIAKKCYLASDNNIGQDGYNLIDKEESLIENGETIFFKGAKEEHKAKDDHGKWPVIASGDSVFGLVSDLSRKKPDEHRDLNGMSAENAIKLEHAASARALYFYENMQGQGTVGTESDKRQDVTGQNKQVSYPDGTDKNDKAWKDAKPYGTYVEIDGYYVNQGNKHPGQGPIKYRFMLGKDEKIDYDAERNHHFALTLNFKGNANDVDFHIDYVEEDKPGLFVPDTTYVSYSYLQPGTVTLRATPRKGYVLSDLEAFLIENEWKPMEDDGQDIYFKHAWDLQASGTWPDDLTGDTDDGEEFYKQRLSVLKSLSSNDHYNKYIKYTTEKERQRNIEWGFLSLRKIFDVIKPLAGTEYNKGVLAGQKFFLEGQESNNRRLKYYRSYQAAIPTEDGFITENEIAGEGKYDGHDDGNFTITRTTNHTNGEIDYIAEVPIFTRAKTIDDIMVYGGSNPYYMHHRKAKIKFRATFKKTDNTVSGPDEYSEYGYTICVQSQRIDNPRMIMRRNDNTAAFLVKLAYLREFDQYLDEVTVTKKGDEETIFEEIISRGPWSATIYLDPDGLIQLTANGKTVTKVGASVGGRTQTPVRFTYQPRKTTTEDKPLCGVIKVLYHNNNCSHYIIVRQGYGPIQLADKAITGGNEIANAVPKVPCFNVWDTDSLCKSPLSIGSLFRRYGNFEYPISEANNEKYGMGVQVPDSYKYKVHGHKDGLNWSEIKSITDDYSTTKSYHMTKEHFTENRSESGKLEFYNPRTKETAEFRLPKYSELPYFGIYPTNFDESANPTLAKELNQFYNAFGIAYADGAKATCLQAKAVRYSDPDNKGLESERGVCGVAIYNHENGRNLFFPMGSTGHGRRKAKYLFVSGTKPTGNPNGFNHYGSVDSKLNRESDIYRPLAYDLGNQKGVAMWIEAGNGTDHGSEKIIAMDFNYGNFMSSRLSFDQLNPNPSSTEKTQNYDALPIRLVYK